MSKIIVIGIDPALRGRIESTSRGRRAQSVQVEYLESADVAGLARKRPHAIVMDVRSPSAATIDVISRLKMRKHQPALMLQVTPQQKQDAAWNKIFPASRTALFTTHTTKKEVQGLLADLLTPPAQDKVSQTSPVSWPEQNDRRINLILQERDSALTASKQKELAGLQQEASRQVNRKKTLDFEALDQFKAEARKIAERI
jgi:response regulator RpfG family c-di-GMP phosphodiesterase